MKFEQSPSKPSVDSQEYTRALLDQLSEQNNLWKLTLGYLAEREVGNPLVIPSILTENRAYSAPQASIVAIRVVTNQTSGVSITANGSIYIPVGLSYTQVPTGQLNQISVGGLNDGNKVWVQYLDERAAAMSAAGDGNVVQLTGSLAPLNADPPRLIAAIPYTDFGTSASTGQNDFARVLTRNARHRTFSAVNALNQAVSADDVYLWDSSIKPGGAPADLVGSGINIGQANSTAGIMAADDAEFPVLGRSVDSLSISLTAAANPTSGSFYLYVTELI